MIKIAPSVLAADILHLEEDVRRVLDAGADLLHLDIMDAHFVPNLSFGPSFVAALRKGFPDTYLGVHLMMTDPIRYLDAFMDAGASAITVHEEIGEQAALCLHRLREKGVDAGLSLKPATGAGRALPLLPVRPRPHHERRARLWRPEDDAGDPRQGQAAEGRRVQGPHRGGRRHHGG